MTDIFLYAGEANPNDIRLRDPTVAGGGGGPATITGTLAATEASDTAAFAGLIAHTGTLAASEASDTVAFVGTVAHTGALSVTEASDTASLAGSIAHTGTMAATEAEDAFAASGTVTGSGVTITGDLVVTEAADTAAVVGLINHTGALSATEDGDTASIVGNISAVQIIGGGGYSRHDTYYNLEGVRERQRKNLEIWENEVLIDAEQVVGEIKTAEPYQEKVLLEESERVSANLQELVIELQLKELELVTQNKLAEIEEVKKTRERLQAQIEEIDAVFVMFMMALEC
jgi:hypothetical protein